MLKESRTRATRHYTNAKIALVGDSGVGKSGLALVLSRKPFTATESTHARKVVSFQLSETEVEPGWTETREVLLWDLAGQPNYRLVHQLHLDQISVALVVFDSRSSTDPFAGVLHWARALRQAEGLRGQGGRRIPKFLVAARIDRGGIGVGRERIDGLVRDAGFDGYFETSAKMQIGIAELADAISAAIDWESLPRVTSPELFAAITRFLLEEKEQGRFLLTSTELYQNFLNSQHAPTDIANVREKLETCVRLLESQGLLQRLSFGDLILLQPEYIDAYASNLISAALQQPDGIGAIREEDARAGRFPTFSEPTRISPQHDELLRIATLETLLRHEIALREETADGAQLVFPSQFARERPDLPEPAGKAVVYTFEGPLLSVYTTLVVRLAHSGLFSTEAMWRNAATFRAQGGGQCGFYLRELDEARGEIGLFFEHAGRETRIDFANYVHVHLQRHASSQSIICRECIVCPTCDTPVGELAVQRRRERGLNQIRCSVCDTSIFLDDSIFGETRQTPALNAIDQAANARRKQSTVATIVQGKQSAKDYDVFFSCDPGDKPAVKALGEALKLHGILPWFDDWEIKPGEIWAESLERGVQNVKTIAVFFGDGAGGPGQEADIAYFGNRGIPIIPVILTENGERRALASPLASRQFVDGRRQEGDVASELIRGITGKSPDDVRLVEHADTRPVPSPEIELEAQFLAARDSKDFGAATQVRYKQARLLLEMGRSDEAAALLLEALKIADEPSLNGTKFRDSLIALLQINTGELENWINSAVHRTAALGELREVPDECQSAAIRVLRMAGIAEWENWFQAPIVDTQALLSLPRAGNGWPAARLLRLRLHNIKSFPTLMLDFREALGAPRLCSAFVGDNGTGKSTLLQTIAVACLGAKAASKIPGLAMRLIRQGASSCEIEAEFELRLDVIAPEQERKLDAEMREAETLTVSVGVEISPIDEDFRLLSQPRMQFGDTNRAAHWEAMRSHTGFHWGLCCAYGAFRNLRERMGSSASPSAYASPEIDRVLSLFQPHSALIEPTFLEKLLQDGDVSAFAPNMPRIPLIERDRLLSMFQQMIPGLTVEQDADGTRRLVEERGGIRVRAFASLSDGCNSMLGLLGHLCRHCLEVTGWTANPLTLGGIVLIDEIDLHLHPSWQRRCLPQLQSAFPNIQFIVTTHSPLILGGVPDGRVTVLRRDPITGIVISDSDTPSVKGWRVDQLLTGLHFETFSYDLDTERITMQYAQIVNNPNASADEIAAAETALKNQKSSVRQELPPDLEAIRLVRQDTDQRLANMDMEQRKRVLAELLGSLPGGA